MVAVLDTAAPMERDLSAMAGWDDTQWLVAIAKILGHMYNKSAALTYEALSQLAWPAQIDALARSLAIAGVVQPRTDPDTIRGFVEVYKTQAQIRYQPATQPRINVVLFRAREPLADFLAGMPESLMHDETWGWHQYSDRRPMVEYVPGDHLTMMVQPHVRMLAQRLSVHLGPAGEHILR
jgi:thioesterase domain-containing protein